MNLEDLIDPEFGLQQDDFVGTKFGNDNQLEVVGWSGRNSSYGKFYILHCKTCSSDSEMFGGGYFKSLKSALVNKNVLPCGCAVAPRRSEKQYLILAQRKAESLGHQCLGFAEPFKGQYTKLKLQCPKHGIWNTTSVNSLVNNGHSCPKCRVDAARQVNTKPDEDMIASFFASGAFHPDTKFSRSERKDSNGYSPYWVVDCPVCGERGEAISTSFQKGYLSCLCAHMRQKSAYVNMIKNENGECFAIKFGVANNPKERAKQQFSTALYDFETYGVWEFQTKQDCLSAERTCMSEVSGPVLSKTEMPDGWTETTYPYNLDKIVEIYEEYGGVRVQ